MYTYWQNAHEIDLGFLFLFSFIHSFIQYLFIITSLWHNLLDIQSKLVENGEGRMIWGKEEELVKVGWNWRGNGIIK
jgi:hypothetical protein